MFCTNNQVTTIMKVYLRTFNKRSLVMLMPKSLSYYQLKDLIQQKVQIDDENLILFYNGEKITQSNDQIIFQDKSILHLINYKNVNKQQINFVINMLHQKRNQLFTAHKNQTIKQFLLNNFESVFERNINEFSFYYSGRVLNLQKTFLEELIQDYSEIICQIHDINYFQKRKNQIQTEYYEKFNQEFNQKIQTVIQDQNLKVNIEKYEFLSSKPTVEIQNICRIETINENQIDSQNYQSIMVTTQIANEVPVEICIQEQNPIYTKFEEQILIQQVPILSYPVSLTIENVNQIPVQLQCYGTNPFSNAIASENQNDTNNQESSLIRTETLNDIPVETNFEQAVTNNTQVEISNKFETNLEEQIPITSEVIIEAPVITEDIPVISEILPENPIETYYYECNTISYEIQNQVIVDNQFSQINPVIQQIICEEPVDKNFQEQTPNAFTVELLNNEVPANTIVQQKIPISYPDENLCSAPQVTTVETLISQTPIETNLEQSIPSIYQNNVQIKNQVELNQDIQYNQYIQYIQQIVNKENNTDELLTNYYQIRPQKDLILSEYKDLVTQEQLLNIEETINQQFNEKETVNQQFNEKETVNQQFNEKETTNQQVNEKETNNQQFNETIDNKYSSQRQIKIEIGESNPQFNIGESILKLDIENYQMNIETNLLTDRTSEQKQPEVFEYTNQTNENEKIKQVEINQFV